MNKLCILTTILACFYLKSLAQADTMLINAVATRVTGELKYYEKKSGKEFGPSAVSWANLVATEPQNNQITFGIRKLLFEKKFASEEDLFKWLLPAANRVALKNYFFNGRELQGDEARLIPGLTDLICPCLAVMHNAHAANIFTDSSTAGCIRQVLTDTALFAALRQYNQNAGPQQAAEFVQNLLYYAQLHCDAYFNSLTGALLHDVFVSYKKEWAEYPFHLAVLAGYYRANNLKDSLQTVFPACGQFQQPLTQIGQIVKSNKKLAYPSQTLVTSDNYSRENTYFVTYVNRKTFILGQAVYEVGTDKVMPYLRNVKFYPRASLQNVEKIEAVMPPPPDEFLQNP